MKYDYRIFISLSIPTGPHFKLNKVILVMLSTSYEQIIPYVLCILYCIDLVPLLNLSALIYCTYSLALSFLSLPMFDLQAGVHLLIRHSRLRFRHRPYNIRSRLLFRRSYTVSNLLPYPTTYRPPRLTLMPVKHCRGPLDNLFFLFSFFFLSCERPAVLSVLFCLCHPLTEDRLRQSCNPPRDWHFAGGLGDPVSEPRTWS